MVCRVDLSVIIVSNNHKEYLDRCLTALSSNANLVGVEILVVDNCSSDGTADYVADRFPKVRLFAEDMKRGYAANNNIAIRASCGRYLMLLNPDTEIVEDALLTLVDFMDTNESVGICGPQLRFPDGSVQLSCRAFPTWKTVLARRTPLRVFLRKSRLNQRHLLSSMDHNRIQPVDWILGASMMIRRDMLDQIGILDERFFLYVEDIDICLRAHNDGWAVIYVPDAVVIHHHLAVSDSRFISKHMYYHTRSMIYYGIKHKLPDRLSFLRRLAYQ